MNMLPVWYFPSWNGDLRLEAQGQHCTLSIVKPTPHEKKICQDLFAEGIERHWLIKSDVPWRYAGSKILLRASVQEVGELVKALMYGTRKAVLTATVHDDASVTITTNAEKKTNPPLFDKKELLAAAKRVEEPDASVASASAAKGKKPKAAATVQRPTPSCPQCVPGSIGPAREVLLSFLSQEQHTEWAKDRSITVIGGTTGCRYLISHRHSVLAQRQGRICYSLDDQMVVHFHDTSVPPEEEVLAAKLILEHREAWLRNEATMLMQFFGCMVPMKMARDVFKNPFGDITDGMDDAAFTQRVGAVLSRKPVGRP